MSEYRAPLKDMEFILNNVLEVQNSKIPGYKDLDNEFVVSILKEAGKICSDVLFPLNHIGDSEGCVLENGVVRTPSGFKEAFKKSVKTDGQQLIAIQNMEDKAFHIFWVLLSAK